MTPRKLDFVSALRGLAALYVAAFHLRFATLPMVHVPDWLEPAVAYGRTGVTLFFVLSAFTLSLSMSSRQDEQAPVLNFYIRRIFRIVPLFYLWIALTMLRDGVIFHGAHYSIWDIAINLLMVFNFFPGHESGIAYASWSIGVEMLFYAAFPFVFATCRTWRGTAAWLIASLAIAEFWRWLTISIHPIAWPFPYIGILNQFPVFIMGFVTYHAYIALRDHISAKLVGIVAIILAGAGTYLLAYTFKVDRVESSLYLRALTCGLLILGLGLMPMKIIVNRWMVFVGEISFSVYLSHTTGLFVVIRGLHLLYERFSPLIAFGTGYLFLLAIVLPISYATFRLVENPGNHAGKVLIFWIVLRNRSSLMPEKEPEQSPG